MFIDTLNRLVYEEGELIKRRPPNIPEGTTIKIGWDSGWNISNPENPKFFKDSADYFTVLRTISTDYTVSDVSESITINGETREKSKGRHRYSFTVKFINKEPLYSSPYRIIYYPELFQMGRVSECSSIKCLIDEHIVKEGNRRMGFENLKFPDLYSGVIRCEQKLALSKLLNERLSENSPIETNTDIITLISNYINKDYYSDDHKWESWEKVKEAGYYDTIVGFGGGGKKKKIKSKRKKKKTKRRKSKRKKHKTKRRK
jgi:hypothetical protein